MSTLEILQDRQWYGPREELLSEQGSLAQDSPAQRLVELFSRFTAGDFRQREALRHLIVNCHDNTLRARALRLYCHTATHQDIPFLEDMLGQWEYDDLHAFAVFAPSTLSLRVVPPLLSLAEDCSGMSLGDTALLAVDQVFPFGYDGAPVDFQAVRMDFDAFVANLDLGIYYYMGKPVFPGDLTRSLMAKTAPLRVRHEKMELAIEPSLLSVWSGVKCPVYYGDVITDAKFGELLNYIEALAAMPWGRGTKYFYGHEVI